MVQQFTDAARQDPRGAGELLLLTGRLRRSCGGTPGDSGGARLAALAPTMARRPPPPPLLSPSSSTASTRSSVAAASAGTAPPPPALLRRAAPLLTSGGAQARVPLVLGRSSLGCPSDTAGRRQRRAPEPSPAGVWASAAKVVAAAPGEVARIGRWDGGFPAAGGDGLAIAEAVRAATVSR
ncbi:hypothetical protein HK405_002465 [Cladochytrium tenue]|nr:hypothetical protein HK405_002465 [Cladochytrium tenue]